MVINDDTIDAGLNYIRTHPQIKDVLISGGDPLLLSDDRLDWLLASIRAIPSVEIIRIGSRVPCTLPMRITTRLCHILKKYHPLYINTHFNHPDEITAEASLACKRLADVGIPLGCQTVLLKGVNDDATTMATLMRKLLTIRVKPYYLFQGDLTRGTNHFRTTIETGQDIMQQLIGHTSGMAVPTFAVDGPDGAGKIPLTPNYIQSLGKQLCFTNYQGKTCFYDNG
jgi:lysine 2,3-aminomutase